jgi:PKD repeat protein
VDQLGNAIAVWSDNARGTYDVWANRYVADSGWGNEVVIENNDTGDAHEPRIAVDDAGNAIVVWHQMVGPYFPSCPDHIWANRYVAGVGWDVAELIEMNTSSSAMGPRLAMDRSGNAIATWTEVVQSVSVRVWTNRYSAASGWSTAEQLDTGDVTRTFGSDIAMDHSGRALMVWAGDMVYSSTCNFSTAWGQPEIVTSHPANAGQIQDLKIAVDAQGNALVGWRQLDGTYFSVYANRYVTEQEPPPPRTHAVLKGAQGPRASAVTWEYAPSDYGTWNGDILNNGLRSVLVDVYDTTSGLSEEIMHQRIRFAANDAYPYGVVNTSGIEMSPIHRYMIAVTPNGPRGSSCVVEDMFESQGMPPEADYVLTIHEIDIYTVHADGSTSYSPNGMIVSYVWDFGDGYTATGMTADHPYSSIGLFQITLTVTDNIGLQDTAQYWVHIYPVFVIFNITVTDYTVTVDASFIDPGGMLASHAWDWGDGETGSSATATHTYAVAGTYLITLVTTDYYGNTEQASQYVTVPNPFA